MNKRAQSLTALAGEVRTLFHQMAAMVEALHGDNDGIGAPHRGVLESLWRDGDQTVPALARARPVSRQHIQVLVNALLALGMVEEVANPAHRRSPLIRLTSRGRERFASMRAREIETLDLGRLPVTVGEMEAATETLRRVRDHVAKVQGEIEAD